MSCYHLRPKSGHELYLPLLTLVAPVLLGRPWGVALRESVMARLAAAAAAGPVRARRRKLPFGRAAVLSVAGREHIVGLADVSATGAFLVTTARFPVGQEVVVKVMPIPGRREVRLPARVVRIAQTGEESPQHPHGLAVQFAGLDQRTREILEDFVNHVPKRQRMP